jgi:hypothetical protein
VRDDVAAYIHAIHPDRRPLFDRVHRLVIYAHPDADVVLVYKMPTYVSGERPLHLGVWRHGRLSSYGLEPDRDGGLPGGVRISTTAGRAETAGR